MNRFITKTSQQFFRVTICSLVCTLLIASCRPATTEPISPLTGSVQIDGQNYPIQLIGDQQWTTVNYNGTGGIPYGTGSEKPIYGRYYTYDEARSIALPPGWRLPTLADWTALVKQQGIVLEKNTAKQQEAVKKLLSTQNWRRLPGTNASGFNAQPAGYSTNNQPPQDGDIAEFWVASGESMSIQESSYNHHLLRFYGNGNDPSVRYTIRFVSGE